MDSARHRTSCVHWARLTPASQTRQHSARSVPDSYSSTASVTEDGTLVYDGVCARANAPDHRPRPSPSTVLPFCRLFCFSSRRFTIIINVPRRHRRARDHHGTTLVTTYKVGTEVYYSTHYCIFLLPYTFRSVCARARALLSAAPLRHCIRPSSEWSRKTPNGIIAAVDVVRGARVRQDNNIRRTRESRFMRRCGSTQ